MDFSKEILELLNGKIGAVTIVDAETSQIVYGGSDCIEEIMEECPALNAEKNSAEWEFLHIMTRKYYKCNSVLFEKNGKNYIMHLQNDVTEYMSLNRDVTKYMAFFKKLSAFQTAVLENLSNTYYELLPMLLEYFKGENVYFMIQRDNKLDIIKYIGKEKIFENARIDYDEKVTEYFDKGETGEVLRLAIEGDLPSLHVLCNGNALNQNYSIVFPESAKLDKDSMSEKTLINVIKLFVENTMLREKLVYESEHDKLTGLYNKGKYLQMTEQTFPNAGSIAIFNFDVNDLKIMNDTYGHEAGDKLLIKAADSIRKVVNNNTFGFRMGGDEYLMVAINIEQEEVDRLRKRWEEELARLNEADDGINCVIAVGVAYAKSPYDFSELTKIADALMYEDKKIKKAGREIR
ncbi:MAG: GGDEF domain-containing protein [Lachnospiraceae bacterium]|nr:GGDEF domain-containing protein [Lachnospiraceae bacterium]